jgi:DNA-directed RNA polymerase alpha subunit
MKKILLTLLTILALSNFNTNAFNAKETVENVQEKIKNSYNKSTTFIKKHKKAAAGITLATIATPTGLYLLKNKKSKVNTKTNIAPLSNANVSDEIVQETDIEELALGTRINKALKQEGINTVEALVLIASGQDLIDIAGIGAKSKDTIKAAIQNLQD